MLDINAVERVLDRRSQRGATDKSLISWLTRLKKGSWKNQPKAIENLIDAIKQTPISNVYICKICNSNKIKDLSQNLGNKKHYYCSNCKSHLWQNKWWTSQEWEDFIEESYNDDRPINTYNLGSI